jgi:hypothetical protein
VRRPPPRGTQYCSAPLLAPQSPSPITTNNHHHGPLLATNKSFLCDCIARGDTTRE